MNPTAEVQKHPRQDTGLIRSNPVYVANLLLDDLAQWFREDCYGGRSEGRTRFSRCLEMLADCGGRVPDLVIERFRELNALPTEFRLMHQEDRPGVLGLAVDLKTKEGFVLPLRPKRLGSGTDWEVARTLPFPAEDVQALLVELMHVNLPHARGVPERLAYRFTNPLQQRVRGNSMTVAAVLAVLDELGGETAKLLQAAVALIELGIDGALEEVDEIDAKLATAFREHGRLSLVVAREGCPALRDLDRTRIECVWEVRTVRELAAKLNSSELLTPLIKAGTAPLSRTELVRIQNRLQSTIDHEHNYADAADLADRVRGCDKEPPIDPGVLTEIGRLATAACEHCGRFADAASLGLEVYDKVRGLDQLASDDEEATTAAVYAAALFDAHEFEAIPDLLNRWAAEAVSHPRKFRTLTRLMVWNTLGRARVLLGPDGWEEWFNRSLELNRRVDDRGGLLRTSSYLLYGLVRHGRSDEAVRQLDQLGEGRDKRATDAWAGFRVANVARCSGIRWEDPELDRVRPDDSSAVPKQAFGFYLQATARQQTRDSHHAGDRFLRAAEFLRAEAGSIRQNICVLFAAALELAAAAHTSDTSRWTASAHAIREFLAAQEATSLRRYYADVVEVLPTDPDPAAAEHLLCRIPYF